MPVSVNVANAGTVELYADGPNHANRLFILSGVAVFDFKGDSHSWRRDKATFVHPGVSLAGHQVKAIRATGGLAAISNTSWAKDAGWAVDEVRAAVTAQGEVALELDLAVRDTDGFVHRVAYEVFIQTREG